MVNSLDHIKILDFGLSTNARGVNDSQIVGTPYYMAPEMINGKVYNEKVDIWSCGVLLYSLVSGHMPFPDET